MRRLLRGRPEAPSAPSRALDSAPGEKTPGLPPEIVAVGLKALAGAAARQVPRTAAELVPTDLGSRPARFEETTSGWFSYWAAALDCAPRPHRKLWEFAAVLQALFDRGLLVPGARALGMGVGDEPVASALAKLGLDVTATDLEEALVADRVRRPNLSQEVFDARVRLAPWNALDPPANTLGEGFDIAWSCGLLSQLGGVEGARTALDHSLAQLRPGGWVVHTFDFAFETQALDGDNRLSRPSIVRLAEAGRGAATAASFDLGSHPLDGYIDPPPFDVSGPFTTPVLFSDEAGAPHLKALIGEGVVTSYILLLQA